MNNKVGIVGSPGEEHTIHMKAVLQELGAEPIVIDALNFPERVSFSLRDDTPIYEGQNLDGVEAFYNRTIYYSEPPYDLDEQLKSGRVKLEDWYSAYAAERERQSLLGSWMRAIAFRAKRVANPVECLHLHYLRPHELTLLRRAGVAVPNTLVTNNPEELLLFKKEVGEVAYSPVAGSGAMKRLSNDDLLPERLQLLISAPVIFQEFQPGTHVRVFVLNRCVLSAVELESDTDNGSEQLGEIVDIPESVAQMCLKAAETCSMVFASIDLKKSTRGEYRLTDCNPAPRFVGVQTPLGGSIERAFAEYLIGN